MKLRALISKINFLGDAIVFLPTLKGLMDNIPDLEIIMLTTPIGKEVIENSVNVKKFIVVDYHRFRTLYKSPVQLLNMALEVKKLNCDIALFSYDEPSMSYIISFLAGIKRRIGFRSRISKFNFLLNEKIETDFSKNVVEINFELVKYLTGIANLRPQRVKINYSSEDILSVERYLESIGISNNDTYIVIHPFAKLKYREWGLQNYLQIADLIEKGLGIKVIIVLERKTQIIPPEYRVVYGLSIKKLAYLIEKATLFIGNNSGPMHIAGAMGTNTLTIWGPSANQWEIYWNDARHIKISYDELDCIPCEKIGFIPGSCTNQIYPNGCMREIKVELVYEIVKKFIQG